MSRGLGDWEIFSEFHPLIPKSPQNYLLCMALLKSLNLKILYR